MSPNTSPLPSDANDQTHGFILDSNGFVRSALHLSAYPSPLASSCRRRPPTFTPKVLLDLLLTALHIPLSSSRKPHLQPCRPKRLRFSKACLLVPGVLDDFSHLLSEIRMGIEIVPLWDEDPDPLPSTSEDEYSTSSEPTDMFLCRRWTWESDDDYSISDVDSLPVEPTSLEDWSLWHVIWAMLTLIPLIHVMARYFHRLRVADPKGRFGAGGGSGIPVPS
ncbi:hypothetical protein HK097_011055 [Rhizophlyctis rosea]|uniref:Uncharacterized protein n=1 Tax=Rhizophlyctis rosea TaxID=64517 RepID=A0AAD5X3V8_9FUNG|nr:hypothetical protein HK097_011055 [Rhizophlyctis rosea]